MIVGLVCGCIVVGAVLVVLVTTLLVRKRCKLSKRDLGDDWMDLEEENRAYTRSAPNTRYVLESDGDGDVVNDNKYLFIRTY